MPAIGTKSPSLKKEIMDVLLRLGITSRSIPALRLDHISNMVIITIAEHAMTDEVIERVTRACAEADGQVWDGLPKTLKLNYTIQASASIATLLE